MSWDNINADKRYMVEADDGSNYYFLAEDMYIVKDEFAEKFPQLKIKTIYCEVYSEQEDDYDGQPDEAQEWYDFDPEC